MSQTALLTRISVQKSLHRVQFNYWNMASRHFFFFFLPHTLNIYPNGSVRFNYDVTHVDRLWHRFNSLSALSLGECFCFKSTCHRELLYTCTVITSELKHEWYSQHEQHKHKGKPEFFYFRLDLLLTLNINIARLNNIMYNIYGYFHYYFNITSFY